MNPHIISNDKYGSVFWLLLVACLLIGFGDFRNLLTPLGYWLAWAIWAFCVIFVLIVFKGIRLVDIKLSLPKPVYVVFFLLVSGMVLTAITIPNYLSLYQAVKITVISFLFGVFCLLIRHVSVSQVVSAIRITLLLLVLLFILSKFLGTPAWVRLGDGREGMAVAWPGVLWKTAVLFLPLLLANIYVEPKSWLWNGASVGLGLYLLILDGSRTGFLLVVIMILGVFLLGVINSEFRKRMTNLRCLAAIACAFLAFTSVNVLVLSNQSFPTLNDISPVISDQSESVFRHVQPLALERLDRGDSDRLSLLKHGWEHSQRCLPFGCGFETTASLSHGIIMPVHNAYLAAFGDFGVLGLIGMLGFVCVAAWPLRNAWRHRSRIQLHVQGEGRAARQAYLIGSSTGAMAFCGTLMLHTFTSEMSEWGLFSLLLALSWSLMWKSFD